MSFIRCEELTREYRKGEEIIRPLDGLDLEIPRGDFLALMGPSGSSLRVLIPGCSARGSP